MEKQIPNLIEELRWRGMLQDSTPDTEKYLLENKISGYIGFDPTADSLHIGNLATIMLLVHLQRAGHTPYALVGGATGMVGDPSGKSAERNLLDEPTLRHNEKCIGEQLKKFLDFEGENAAVLVNNYDWFKEFSFLEFLRDVGKHLSVNYMMAKDSVKTRLETGISFTEFSYQLLQAYDFYYLYKNHGVKLQMGGSDQWGNITSGTELIRRISNAESDNNDDTRESAFAVTCPLVTKADGSKFGKSESGNVWLDPNLTSPYKFYQFWLNADDDVAPRLIRVFTLLDKETIESLEIEHEKDKGQRILQKALAEDVTKRVHGEEAYDNAVAASQVLFGKDVVKELQQIDERTLLEIFEGVPQIQISLDEYHQAENVTELLSTVTDNRIFVSKSEAKNMIKGGGVSINKAKIADPVMEADFALLQDKYLLVQRGKKNYYLVSVSK
ncbi:tyrosine--tRNA ligase [Bernardetia sp.]|uniref:tyrosine--tRNA ligase n=1 Tax=Bernardetia sp. TaxID=1937974 RepID=UPI0025BD4713|nr:tyrosine--tRNA ligase [Bernardetia sp.]